jgi:hypothetical protein
MKFTVQFGVCSEDGRAEQVHEVMSLDKASQRIEHLSLTLAEAKSILKTLQQHSVEQQATVFVAAHAQCHDCGTALGIKGHHTRPFRTLFGAVTLTSPRLYHCHCQPRKTTTFRPRLSLLISTGFVESTFNQVISKRFCKKHQRQWTKRGTHLLLQTRVKTLNQELGAMLQRWYPDVQLEEEPQAA